MRILVISDSHGKGMVNILRSQGVEARFMSIIKGRPLLGIRKRYRASLQRIRRFAPDKIVMHMGHNDLVRHHMYNPEPKFITCVVRMVIEFAVEILSTFPNSELYISSLQPRVAGIGLSEEGAKKYNRLAKRFGEHIVTQSKKLRCFTPILVRGLWGKISLYEAKLGVFRRDGLHLNKIGRDIMAEKWVSTMIV
jgi:lysophospholipase L1-like esterase